MTHAVRIVCDFAEEGWPSMDYVADVLAAGLAKHFEGTVDLQSIRPAMVPLPHRTLARALNRYVYYPWFLRKRRSGPDVFHVIDHSYAHLVHQLPPERTVVTCHDIDAFRCLLEGRQEHRSRLFRTVSRWILAGMQKAARVICVSEATRNELVNRRLVDPRRACVVENAVAPEFTPRYDPQAERELERLLGPRVQGTTELLHVGSTARRKRLDVLMKVAVELRRKGEPVRLIRVGPQVPAELNTDAAVLAAAGAFVSLPFLSRAVLAALYRRADLLLQTSDAEGFALPVAEAMACGLTVIVSDLPVLREIGGQAAHFCPPGDVAAWTRTVRVLLNEGNCPPADLRSRRRQANLECASRFSLDRHISGIVKVYEEVSGSIWTAPPGGEFRRHVIVTS
jgi:glycosyltransferase involved in cell wall biosynthesis